MGVVIPEDKILTSFLLISKYYKSVKIKQAKGEMKATVNVQIIFSVCCFLNDIFTWTFHLLNVLLKLLTDDTASVAMVTVLQEELNDPW